MIVPRYWAEARLRHRELGRQVTVRRFGWSDVSQEEAERLAQERAQNALTRILAGEKLPRREHKVPYNGAEGLPIREEVVAVHGNAVVTRNAYGALCINTPDVLFADIDYGNEGGALAWVLGLFSIAAALVGLFFGLELRWLCLGCFLALAAWASIPSAIDVLMQRLPGGHEGLARRRVARFVARHRNWCVRLYRTPGGMRVLALHETFDPTEPAVTHFFEAVRADRQYMRMCERQRCFRARVTPKPWRVGMQVHIKPRPGVWPVDPKRLGDRNRWVAEYERASAGYAACRYLETLGNGFVHPVTEDVRALHDELCNALSNLPIA